MSDLTTQKAEARRAARQRRATLFNAEARLELVAQFPSELKQTIIAGFAPTQGEINLWPLLRHLHSEGREIALPVVGAVQSPLSFRRWTPGCVMTVDRYGISTPMQGDVLTPQLVLLPLLAYTSKGDRLGYGGGYYDRTLAALRRTSDVFACGVAYAGQEVPDLPTEAHDAPLDGILTDTGFRKF